MPGFFGSRANFQQRYALPVERDRDVAAVEALRKRIRPFVLGRLKTEVAKELPPRQEKILYCELGAAQRALYERVKNTYRQTVLERVDSMGMRQSTLPVLEALMRLRQACCDPGLLPFPEAEEIGEEIYAKPADSLKNTGYTLTLNNSGPNYYRIKKIIAELRPDLSTFDIYDMLKHAPQTIAENLPEATAQSFQQKLEAAECHISRR